MKTNCSFRFYRALFFLREPTFGGKHVWNFEVLLSFWDPNHNEKKVSEAEACRLASAFSEELSALKADVPVESHALLSSMSRLHQTGHAPRLFQEFDQFGRVAPIKERLVYIEAGMSQHPTLPFRSIVECLSSCGKLQTLLGDDFWILDTLPEFWSKYRAHYPNHPIYSLGADRLKNTIPLLAHADEGTGIKKKKHNDPSDPARTRQGQFTKFRWWIELCWGKHCYPLPLQCDDGKGLCWKKWKTLRQIGGIYGQGVGRTFHPLSSKSGPRKRTFTSAV